MVDICLFPIPDCVTFPGTVFPLHVFEPRYRAMIRDCIDHKRPVAICHTRKLIHAAPGHQSPYEALQSNQATYRPYDVFSAGRCELIRVLPDGRMYLNVHIRQRYRAIQEKQTLPYMLYECEPFVDRPLNTSEQHNALELQDKIIHRLQALAFHYPELQEGFDAEQWMAKSVEEFSFQLFGMISFGSDSQQQILEMNTATARLEEALSLLNQLGG